jgi:hypothetical protein
VLKDASNEDVPVIRDGMKMVTERAAEIPLMALEYALNDQARNIVSRYADIV